jgi:hypothetical protein
MTSNAVGDAKVYSTIQLNDKRNPFEGQQKPLGFFPMERSLAFSTEYVNFLQIIPSKFEREVTLSLPSDGLNRERLFVSLLRAECDRRIGTVAKPRIK